MKKKSKKSGWYKKLPVLVMSDWAILDPPALYLTVLFKLWPKNMQRWQFVPNDSAPHSDGRIVKKQETRNLCLNRKRESINDVNLVSGTGKSLSEALIFALTNPQYVWQKIVHENCKLRQRLLSPSLAQNTCRTCCVHKLLFLYCFDIQNNFGTQHVLQMLRASEKDLPVLKYILLFQWKWKYNLPGRYCR